MRGAESNPKTRLDLGAPLDLKFRYALAHELDGDETVRASLFRPARKFTRRTFGFKRTVTVPADLVALTSRRLLWITDRDEKGYARYGSVARYTWGSIAAITCTQDGNDRVLLVAIGSSGIQWQIPVGPEHWDAAARLEHAMPFHKASRVTASRRAPQVFEP